MTKGMVADWEIKKPPIYRYFTNGEYCNPQTHEVFLSIASKGSWWHFWDFENIKISEKEITVLKIVEPDADIIFELSANAFCEIKNYNKFKEK